MSEKKDWVGGRASVFKTLGASNHTDHERAWGDYYATEPKATEWRLFMSSKRNCQLFIDGTDIRYRNHERDKKGKLIRCEAYFTERLTLIREVK